MLAAGGVLTVPWIAPRPVSVSSVVESLHSIFIPDVFVQHAGNTHGSIGMETDLIFLSRKDLLLKQQLNTLLRQIGQSVIAVETVCPTQAEATQSFALALKSVDAQHVVTGITKKRKV